MSNTLVNGGYSIFNKVISRELGIECAALLGELYSKYLYYKEKNQLYDGMFFYRCEDIQREIGISRFQRQNATKKLQDAGILEVKKASNPAKNYYKINEENLEKFINEFQWSKNQTTSSPNISTLEVQKLDNILLINKNNNTNNKNNIKWYSHDAHTDVNEVDWNLYGDDYNEKSLDVVKAYFKAYKRYTGKSHPILNKNALNRAITRLERISSEVLGSDEPDLDNFQELIDKHFRAGYSQPIDYNILHFLNSEIVWNRFYETYYH